jgi:hypothetical protein
LIGRDIGALEGMIRRQVFLYSKKVTMGGVFIEKIDLILSKRSQTNPFLWHFRNIAPGNVDVLNSSAFINKFFTQEPKTSPQDYFDTKVLQEFIEKQSEDDGVVIEKLNVQDGNEKYTEYRKIKTKNSTILSNIKQDLFYRAYR